jgi:hypothetical protein
MRLSEIMENASGGASSSGGIATSLGGAAGFTTDMSASIYEPIKRHRKQRKKKALENDLKENVGK